MQIAVVGAGAMGSRFGAELQRAGHVVLLVDPWSAHVDAIQERGGLLVDGDTESTLVPVSASLPASSSGRMELILVFGKAMQTASLIRSASHLVSKSTIVLTLQNGLGNIEALGEVVPRQNLVAGVTTIGTELLGPGRIRSLGTGDTYVMQVDGATGTAVGAVVDAFADSAIPVTTSSDVQSMIWTKVAFNCVLNTLCTLMQCPVSTLRLYPGFFDVAEEMINEIVQVAAAEGVTVDPVEVRSIIEGATDPKASGHHLPSMLQDLLNERPTEIEHLNGEVVRRGERHAIATPVNRLIHHLVRMAVATRPERIAALPH